jgi:hypothetical protein
MSAKRAAREIRQQFDSSVATQAARRNLLNALDETGYTGKPDVEPCSRTIRQAVGHPEAPMMTD